MGSRSYAGDTWLLFVREAEQGLVCTVLLTQPTHVVAERVVDSTALNEHVRMIQLLILSYAGITW